MQVDADTMGNYNMHTQLYNSYTTPVPIRKSRDPFIRHHVINLYVSLYMVYIL